MRLKSYPAFILLLFCAFSQPSYGKWYKKSFQVMGTQAHVSFWLEPKISSNNSDKAQQLILAVQNEMKRIDEAMSPYKESSELSKINRLAADKNVTISAELFGLLKTAQHVSALSGGAFDITYASVGYQYDYRKKQRPSKQSIKKALPLINYLAIDLNPQSNTIHFSHQNIKIDLGGIAKGYAVKRCLALLKQAGVEHAMVNAGGDTGLLGDRKGRPWIVGIKHPRAAMKTAVELPLENEAISTSGDYERYFIEDGVRYHHIINPKTGESARELLSVSIIGDDPTLVDALSTTVFVLGLKNGMALVNKLANTEAIIIDKNQRMFFSTGLQQQ